MRTSILIALSFSLLACSRPSPTSTVAPPGRAETPHTQALEVGAQLLQRTAPLAGMDIHLVGFHPMKDDPHQQMEAHHFCRQVNEDFAQCALFDGDGPQANLTGVEYIISEAQFLKLPAAERHYWHPHNGEILTGQLSAPNLPLAAEKQLMRGKMNSYGKTWHTWHSTDGVAPGDALPLGEPTLAWSFNRDGEADPALIARRDRAATYSTAQRRADHQDLTALARLQQGVDALRASFPAAKPVPGVVDAVGEPSQSK